VAAEAAAAVAAAVVVAVEVPLLLEVALVIDLLVEEVLSVMFQDKNYHHLIKHPQDQSDLILTARN
jgi:hypothetical protein